MPAAQPIPVGGQDDHFGNFSHLLRQRQKPWRCYSVIMVIRICLILFIFCALLQGFQLLAAVLQCIEGDDCDK